MVKKDSLEDLAILAGLGIVGYMAYNTYFPGKSAQDIMKSLDTVIKNFFRGLPKAGELNLTSFLPPLPEPALAAPQLPPVQPQTTIIQIPTAPAAAAPVPMPSGAQQPAGIISETPSSNTAPIPAELEPQITEPPPAQKPKNSGEVKNIPMTPSSEQGRGGGESGFSVVAAAGDFDNTNGTSATMDSMEKHNIQHIIGLGDYAYSGDMKSWASAVLGPRFTDRIKGAQGNHDSSGGSSVFNQNGWEFAHKIHPNLACVFINTEGGIAANTLDTLTTQAKGLATNVCYAFHKPYKTDPGGHHPPSENKSGSIIEAAARKHGVRLVLAGHNHVYEHYFKDPIHYVTSGAAGRKFYQTSGGPDVVKFINNTNGFLKINVGPRLGCQFISNKTGTSLDTFTV